jgi:cytochrome c553
LGDAKAVTPALAGQIPLYVIKQLVDMAEREREVPEMHRVVSRKELSRPQGIADVAAYVGQLPPNSAPEVGDGTQLALGERYYQGLCAFCHGEQGGGNEQHATPAPRGQHYSYLLAQMRELANMHRYSVDVAIVEALDGWPVKLQSGKSARIIVTMGMPAFVYRWFYLSHSLRALQRNILRFVGFRRVRATLIDGVGTMSPADRSECLAQVRSLGRQAA